MAINVMPVQMVGDGGGSGWGFDLLGITKMVHHQREKI